LFNLYAGIYKIRNDTDIFVKFYEIIGNYYVKYKFLNYNNQTEIMKYNKKFFITHRGQM